QPRSLGDQCHIESAALDSTLFPLDQHNGAALFGADAFLVFQSWIVGKQDFAPEITMAGRHHFIMDVLGDFGIRIAPRPNGAEFVAAVAAGTQVREQTWVGSPTSLLCRVTTVGISVMYINDRSRHRCAVCAADNSGHNKGVAMLLFRHQGNLGMVV